MIGLTILKFVNKQNHINGIENFWNQAKRHMRKINGVPKEHFGLFLKEYEWRFNNCFFYMNDNGAESLFLEKTQTVLSPSKSVQKIFLDGILKTEVLS